MALDEFIKLINESVQHKRIYHFTDEANFPDIKSYGLLSKAKMQAEGKWPIIAGGNALSHRLDKDAGIYGYVSLCFTSNHPMEYMAKNRPDAPLITSRYLAISPEALKISGVKIAFDIANKNGVRIENITDALDDLDTEVIYERLDWSDAAVLTRLKAAERYEILIPNAVPRELILGPC